MGIGTTIQFYSQPGYPNATGAGVTQVFIPTKTIWIKNHGLVTGDKLTYSPNVGEEQVLMFKIVVVVYLH